MPWIKTSDGYLVVCYLCGRAHKGTEENGVMPVGWCAVNWTKLGLRVFHSEGQDTVCCDCAQLHSIDGEGGTQDITVTIRNYQKANWGEKWKIRAHKYDNGDKRKRALDEIARSWRVWNHSDSMPDIDVIERVQDALIALGYDLSKRAYRNETEADEDDDQ